MVAVLLVVAGAARADVLWYNGDTTELANGEVGLANVVEGSINYVPGTYLTYDDFVVPSGSWLIDSAWSNDEMTSGFAATEAYWEIRSGVSAGNGGTLLYSGTSAATQTDTGQNYYGNELYTIGVTGLDISLGPGTYWLTLAPVDGSNTYSSYVSTTTGLNAVGNPPGNDGHSFFNAPGYDWVPASGQVDYSPADFSMGVGGTTASVPEPCTFALFALGAVGLLRKRRK